MLVFRHHSGTQKMATLTRPSDPKIAKQESSTLIESTNADLASTIPAPFPHLEQMKAPAESITQAERTTHIVDVEDSSPRLMEVKTRPGWQREIEIEKGKVESASPLSSFSILGHSCIRSTLTA